MTACARCGFEAVAGELEAPPLALEVGASLVPWIDPARGGDVASRIGAFRREMAAELGLVLPRVQLRDALFLGDDGYRVLVRGLEVARGVIPPDRCMVVDCDRLPGLDCLPGVDPSFGTPVAWIPAHERDRAKAAGHVVVDAGTVLVIHFGELVRRHADALLAYDDARVMLESASRRSPALVADAVPGVISVSALLDLLRSLLRERVCIRDLERVLEAVVRGGSSASPSQRLAAARRSLSGWITRATTTEGRVHAAWVGDGLAARLRADPSPEALAPLDEALAALVRASMPAVVVAPADVRLPLFERLRVRWSPVYVVSPEELASEVTLVVEPAGAPV